MKRALRRHQAVSHMRRRLKEDRNEHYNDLTCACWTDQKHMARFKEQPKLCSKCMCCDNPRHVWKGKSGLTLQELRHAEGYLHAEAERRRLHPTRDDAYVAESAD